MGRVISKHLTISEPKVESLKRLAVEYIASHRDNSQLYQQCGAAAGCLPNELQSLVTKKIHELNNNNNNMKKKNAGSVGDYHATPLREAWYTCLKNLLKDKLLSQQAVRERAVDMLSNQPTDPCWRSRFVRNDVCVCVCVCVVCVCVCVRVRAFLSRSHVTCDTIDDGHATESVASTCSPSLWRTRQKTPSR
jgi:hypothetical protein